MHKSAPSNDMYIAISVFVFVAGLFLLLLGGGGGVTFNLFLSFVLCLLPEEEIEFILNH